MKLCMQANMNSCGDLGYSLKATYNLYINIKMSEHIWNPKHCTIDNKFSNSSTLSS